jgi:hypothetical protein
MKKLLVISVFILIVFSGCVNTSRPKLVYPENEQDSLYKKVKVLKDSTYFITAELPIQIDSTSYLIHPIGYTKFNNSKYMSFVSRSRGRGKSYMSRDAGSRIDGSFINLKFQHIDSVEMRTLTDKVIRIHSFEHVHFSHSNRQLLIYEINDIDTNLDTYLNSDDIRALYISEIDGSNFKKLSLDYHEVLEWKIIDATHKLFVKTSEDSNKNGVFDKGDTINYYYVDLWSNSLQIVEYFPLQ